MDSIKAFKNKITHTYKKLSNKQYEPNKKKIAVIHSKKKKKAKEIEIAIRLQ